MRTYTFLGCLLCLFLYACGGEGSTASQEDTPETTTAETTPEPAATIALTPMPAAVTFPDASINDFKYQGGQFTFDVSGYELGVQTPDAEQLMCANSDKGQHIHLILDNEPYMAKYTAEFEQEVADGEHYMLAFLSRSYHLSVKEPAAGTAVKTVAENGGFTSVKPIDAPMLFYSRPKGTYRGKRATENVMLDFYPINAPMEEGYQVKAEINGEEFMVDEWRPYYITGLPMGENTVKLTLLDAEGKAVEAPLNPVSRTFTLEELPTGE